MTDNGGVPYGRPEGEPEPWQDDADSWFRPADDRYRTQAQYQYPYSEQQREGPPEYQHRWSPDEAPGQGPGREPDAAGGSFPHTGGYPGMGGERPGMAEPYPSALNDMGAPPPSGPPGAEQGPSGHPQAPTGAPSYPGAPPYAGSPAYPGAGEGGQAPPPPEPVSRPYAPSPGASWDAPPEPGGAGAWPGQSADFGPYRASGDEGPPHQYYRADPSLGAYEGGEDRPGSPHGAYPSVSDPAGYYGERPGTSWSSDPSTEPVPTGHSGSGEGRSGDHLPPTGEAGWRFPGADYGHSAPPAGDPHQDAARSGAADGMWDRYRGVAEETGGPEARVSRLADPLNDPLDGPSTGPPAPPAPPVAPGPESDPGGAPYGAAPFSGGPGSFPERSFAEEPPTRYDDELSRPRADRFAPENEAPPSFGAPYGTDGYPDYGHRGPGEDAPPAFGEGAGGGGWGRLDGHGGVAEPEEDRRGPPAGAEPVSGLAPGAGSDGFGTGSGNTWAFNRDDLTLPGELRQAAIDAEEKRRGGAAEPTTQAFWPDHAAPGGAGSEEEPRADGTAGASGDPGYGPGGSADHYVLEAPFPEKVGEQPWAASGGYHGPEDGAGQWGHPAPGDRTQAMPALSDESGPGHREAPGDAPDAVGPADGRFGLREDDHGTYGRYADRRVDDYDGYPRPGEWGGGAATPPEYGYDQPPADARHDAYSAPGGGHPRPEPAGYGADGDEYGYDRAGYRYDDEVEPDYGEYGERRPEWDSHSRRNPVGGDFPDFEGQPLGGATGDPYPGYDNLEDDYWPETDRGATATLWFGVLALVPVLGLVGAVGALVAGPKARSRVRRSEGELEGENLVRIGTGLAWAGIVLSIVVAAWGVSSLILG